MYSRPNVYSRIWNRRRVGNKRRAQNLQTCVENPQNTGQGKKTVINKRRPFNKAIGPGKIQNDKCWAYVYSGLHIE